MGAFTLRLSAIPLRNSALQRYVYPSPPFFAFFNYYAENRRVFVLFIIYIVGRISDSVIRQDHAFLLGYAALTQATI